MESSLSIECTPSGLSEYHLADPPAATTNARRMGGRGGATDPASAQWRATVRFFDVVGFFVATAFFFDDVAFFALTFAFDFDELDDRALAFDLLLREARADACADDLPRRLRAERDRAACSGRFQPTARSARKERGMLRMPWSESVTASAAASARSARTSLITFAGRRARAAWTRFVSSTTNISR
jgi:hypothetical protein